MYDVNCGYSDNGCESLSADKYMFQILVYYKMYEYDFPQMHASHFVYKCFVRSHGHSTIKGNSLKNDRLDAGARSVFYLDITIQMIEYNCTILPVELPD